MRTLTATPDLIVVDNLINQIDGATSINYWKERTDELWELPPGGGWTLVPVFQRTNDGDAPFRGKWKVVLRPGEIYELGTYEEGKGPLTGSKALNHIRVLAIWKRPERRVLITDENLNSGGTWYWHHIPTNVPTNIVMIGATRKGGIPTNSDGFPRLDSPEGAPIGPFKFTNDHEVEFNHLLPGQKYDYVVVVADASGHWDVRTGSFTTLRRKITVQFPTLHIYNDGDPLSDGEGEFWFQLFFGSPKQPQPFATFNRPLSKIDDWGRTNRPYSLGFAFVGVPSVVQSGQETVWVRSWGLEEDGILEGDEGAANVGVFLRFPAGRSETVVNNPLTIDCPHSTTGDDFHYGVDVLYSVEYST